MDKKKGILNVTVAIIFRVAILVCSLLTRRLVIKYIGNVANGLDSLYASIIGFLSVAELGVGSAITFCMYKPIVEGNDEKVKVLYSLFRRLYLIIGLIILVVGCALFPLLPYLARGYSSADVNLYYTFCIMLVSVVLTYVFSAKISLFNAYKNNYISTAIQSGGNIFQYVLQVSSILIFKSFEVYLWCRIVAVVVQWIATDIVAGRNYGIITSAKKSVDGDTKKEVVKNIKAMFMHKIGGVLINTADSIIISACIGVVVLGKYSNYTSIVIAMNNTIMLFFSPLTSVIGHMMINESNEGIQRCYKFLYYFNFIIGCVFYLGYYAIADNLVVLFFGEGLKMGKSVSFIITLNYFIQFMRTTTTIFRDASGTFYNDRWKPLIEGVVNVVLSVAFVYLFNAIGGAELAVVGVIVATIFTNLFICHIVEPYVLYKYAFHLSPLRYYLKNYLFIVLFIVILFALNFSMVSITNKVVELFVNGFISVAFSLIVMLVIIIFNKDFRYYILTFIREKRYKRLKNNDDSHKL